MKLLPQVIAFYCLLLFTFSINGCARKHLMENERSKQQTTKKAINYASYFPLGIGNNWKYRRLSDGREHTVSIAEKQEINEHIYFYLKGKPEGSESEESGDFLRITTKGVKRLYPAEYNNDSLAQLLIKEIEEGGEVKMKKLKIKRSPADELL